MNEVGIRIKQVREELKMTQSELSQRSGISLPSVRAYEQGKRKPKQEAIEKLANALNVNSLYLSGVANDRFGLSFMSETFGTDMNELLSLKDKLQAEYPDDSVTTISQKVYDSYKLEAMKAGGKDIVEMFGAVISLQTSLLAFMKKLDTLDLSAKQQKRAVEVWFKIKNETAELYRDVESLALSIKIDGDKATKN